MILALTVALSAAPVIREAALERCAAAAVAKLHPGAGMADVTGTTFEGLSVSAAGRDWIVIGSIIEPGNGGRVAHRFACRTRGQKPPRVTLGEVIRL